MKDVSFPSSEMKAFAEIERSLNENLSLQEIEQVGEQILNIETSSQKTKEVAQNLLSRLDIQREKQVQKGLDQMHQMQSSLDKINSLQHLIYFLSPDEVEDCLSKIEVEVALSDPALNQVAIRQLQQLHFQIEQPIVHELNGDIPHTFVAKARSIAEKIMTEEALTSMREFNSRQLQEILRISGRQA